MVPPAKKFLLRGLAAAFLPALTLVCYFPSLSAGFYLDDHLHITNNPALLESRPAFPDLRRLLFHSPLRTRGLSYLSLALDYHRAGLSTPAFHFTNLLIHLLAGLAAWRLLRRIFSTPPLAVSRPEAAAFLGALAFSLNPVQTQSVSYVIQRMNLLAALFTLLGLLAWAELATAERGRRVFLFASLALAAVSGLWSKETAVALFFLMAAWDRCFYRGGVGSWFRARRRRVMMLAGLVGLVSVIYFWVSGGIFSGYASRPFTMGERLLTQPRVVLWYISLWFFPAGYRLSLEHTFPLSTGFFHPPTTLAALLLLAAPTLLAVLRAERRPLMALGWLWFVAGLALESSALPLEMVFEHRLYLPSLGLILISADLLSRLRPDSAVLTCLVFPLLLWAGQTYLRNKVWQDETDLYRDAVRKSPQSGRTWSNLCAVAFTRDRLDSAEVFCKAGLARNPDDANTWYNLGLILLKENRPAEAEPVLRRAGRLREDAETLFQLGRARAALGDMAGAASALEEAVRRDPSDAAYWYNLGLYRSALGKKAEAKAAFRSALQHLSPSDPSRFSIILRLSELEDQSPSPR